MPFINPSPDTEHNTAQSFKAKTVLLLALIRQDLKQRLKLSQEKWVENI